MKNTAHNTKADQAEKADPHLANIGTGPTNTDELTKPSRAESRWLKDAVPTIGASPESPDGGGGTPSIQT